MLEFGAWSRFVLMSAVRSPVLNKTVVRLVVAVIVTVVAVLAFESRDDDVVSWVFLAPTVAVFWMWALSGRGAGFIHMVGLVFPLVLQLVESDDEISMFITIVTVALISMFSPARFYASFAIGLTMFLTGLLGVVGAIDDFAWPNWLFGIAFAWASGAIIWRFTNTVDELEHTRALVADHAVVQERRRIARDVHDLVGHSLSVVMLHISGARLLVHKDPAEAERALLQAEEAGRQALSEIRRTVGLLRHESDEGVPEMPSASLEDVPSLVQDLVAAGQMANLQIAGPIEDLDPASSLAGYRIVQEALTNASRHTVGAFIDVSIVADGASCEVVVTNEGGEVLDLGMGAGFGLVSMRERAKSVGGSLVAGPTRGGWTVEASLPITTMTSRNV